MVQGRECPALAESALLQQALAGQIGKLVDAHTQEHVVKRLPRRRGGDPLAYIYASRVQSVVIVS